MNAPKAYMIYWFYVSVSMGLCGQASSKNFSFCFLLEHCKLLDTAYTTYVNSLLFSLTRSKHAAA